MNQIATDTATRQSNSCRLPPVAAYVVWSSDPKRLWSGPFARRETAEQIIRNLEPIYPGREFRVNKVSVQRI